MPSGTIKGTTGNDYIDSKIEWSYTQDTNANTSTVTAVLYYKRNNSGFTTGGTGTFSISIAGTIKSATKSLTITENAWVEAVRNTITVSHNVDGTKSITIYASGSIPSTTLTSTTCSGTVTLTTIPRASQITSAWGTVGGACNVKWTPASATFRFKIKFSVGTWSHTTGVIHPNTTSLYTYTGYTFPLDVAEQITNTHSGYMTVTLYTYNDSSATAQVGSERSLGCTLTVPDNEYTKPKVEMTLTPDTPYAKFASLYLQGRSKVKATFSGEGKYGASMTEYLLKAEGSTYGDPYTSDVLRNSGSITIVGYGYDSRGIFNTVPQDITVIAYEPPYIAPCYGYNSVVCERCEEDGTASDGGKYLHIKGTRNFTKINTDGIVNTCSVRCRYKPENGIWSHGSGEGVGVLLWTDTSTDTFDVILPNVVSDARCSYTVELNIIDDTYQPSAIVFNIPSEDIDFELREGGRGAAFGKHAVYENLLEVDWDAQFNKGITYKDCPIADVVIEEGTSGIWTYRKWMNGNAECWCRRNVDVTIDTAWGSALYYGVATPMEYPFAFAEMPICQISCEYGDEAVSLFVASSGSGATTYASAVMLCRTDPKTVNCNVLYHAHGKWK